MCATRFASVRPVRGPAGGRGEVDAAGRAPAGDPRGADGMPHGPQAAGHAALRTPLIENRRDHWAADEPIARSTLAHTP